MLWSSFPNGRLGIMRFAARIDSDKALEQGLLDEVVEPGMLDSPLKLLASSGVAAGGVRTHKSQIRQPV